jgi:hypothetical protein
MAEADIGDRIRVTYNYCDEIEIGTIKKYDDFDLDGGGYVCEDDEGDVFYVLFHDLFRGDARIEIL